MDFQLKQWRDQHESEIQHATKIPKLLPDSHATSGSVLPLFVSETNNKVNSQYTFPDSTNAVTRFPRNGSYFSLAQLQELELQALIFRYMLAGAAVPPELIQPIKKSFLHSQPYLLQHYQSALLQSGYWGKAAMDPEPGRCRRTDGKKWRCSRDVTAGHKYCERHMHRGKNRSRKPVESPTSTTLAGVGCCSASAAAESLTVPPVTAATVSMRSPFDILQLNQSSSGQEIENHGLVGIQYGVTGNSSSGDGHVLRHFFDDWPRSLPNQDPSVTNAHGLNSSACLSISMPANSSSDVSLKLFTGDGNVDSHQQDQSGWARGWNPSSHVASMGGPLAEALRSSTSSSPTSVLQQVSVPPCSASDR